ncbi:hypothetical protein ACFVZW_19495 [Streptomyces sp. NPDC059567]|uniref:hypothetical protein n=1 Tax=Streptomyces sp. NPDC059567 TaxID=3346867 RepID=UPI0036782B3D
MFRITRTKTLSERAQLLADLMSERDAALRERDQHKGAAAFATTEIARLADDNDTLRSAMRCQNETIANVRMVGLELTSDTLDDRLDPDLYRARIARTLQTGAHTLGLGLPDKIARHLDVLAAPAAKTVEGAER